MRGHDGDVRVGGYLERSQSTGNDGGADDETTKDGVGVASRCKFGYRPEEDGTERVEAKTHDDGELVTSSSQDFTGNRGECKVTDTEVGCLKTSGLSFSDVKNISEVGVEDIKETVGETPQEEERGNEDESPDWEMSGSSARAHRGDSRYSRRMKPVRRGLPPEPPETTAPPAMMRCSGCVKRR